MNDRDPKQDREPREDRELAQERGRSQGPPDARGASPGGENEGEGSRSGAEKYGRELAEFEEKNDPEKLAEEAARDLDDDSAPTTRPTIDAEKADEIARDRDERRRAA